MDSIQDYSSDSSDQEDIEEDTQDKTLPPIPEEISQKFVKPPKLPDPEFYDLPVDQETMRRFRIIELDPNMIRSYININIRHSKPVYKLIDEQLEDVKFVLKLSPKFNNLIEFTPLTKSPLRVPQNLHISLTNNFRLPKENSLWFSKELSHRLTNFKKIDNHSNIVTFDKLAVFKNFNGGLLYLGLCVSQASLDNNLLNLHKLVNDVRLEASQNDSNSVYPDHSLTSLHVSVAQTHIPPAYENRLDELVEDLNKLIKHVEINPKIQFPYSTIYINSSRDSISCRIGDY